MLSRPRIQIEYSPYLALFNRLSLVYINRASSNDLYTLLSNELYPHATGVSTLVCMGVQMLYVKVFSHY